MTIALSRPRHRPASVPVMIAAVMGAVGLLAVAGVVSSRRNADQPATSIKKLVAYANAIYPAAQQAGQALVAGIRPDIADFRAGKISVDVWTVDMQTRQRELAQARSAFDHAVAPTSVKDAPAWFDRAFDDYQRAVGLLLQAGALEGTQRSDMISRAASIGQAGDRAFDNGTARIQAARRVLGLGPDTRFSDKPATQQR